MLHGMVCILSPSSSRENNGVVVSRVITLAHVSHAVECGPACKGVCRE